MAIKRMNHAATIFAIAGLAGCSRSVPSLFKPTAGERVASRLKDVDHAEVFAIDPFSLRRSEPATSEPADADRFYGYRVLGQATIDGATAHRLAKTIESSVSDPPEGVAKGCAFVPRHGVRFTLASGETIDFIVCFTCGDAQLMSGGHFSDGFWIDRSAVADFNAIFHRNGVDVRSDD